MSCGAKAPDGTRCSLAPDHLEQGFSHHSLASGLLWDDDEFSYRAKVAELVKAAREVHDDLVDTGDHGPLTTPKLLRLRAALKPFEKP